MLRFKLFSGPAGELEDSVNAWLEEFEPDVNQMTQSQDGDIVSISFTFGESFRGQELRLSRGRGMSGDTEPAIPPGVMRDEPIKVQDPGVPPTELSR